MSLPAFFSPFRPLPRLLSRTLNTPSMAHSAHPPLLVTWDIDGTLIASAHKSGNVAHKCAIDQAVNHIHNISITVNDVPHAGSTDFAIITAMCEKGNVPSDKISSNMQRVVDMASARIKHYVHDSPPPLVLPGVRDLLEELRERRVHLALATGNLQDIAWEKLRLVGLDHFFETGGFGSDCFLRTDILKVARQRVGEKDSRGWRDVFHVGDAVADVAAARDAGVKGVGVLTGSFGRSELEAENPLAVLDDLSDTKRFLALLGF